MVRASTWNSPSERKGCGSVVVPTWNPPVRGRGMAQWVEHLPGVLHRGADMFAQWLQYCRHVWDHSCFQPRWSNECGNSFDTVRVSLFLSFCPCFLDNPDSSWSFSWQLPKSLFTLKKKKKSSPRCMAPSTEMVSNCFSLVKERQAPWRYNLF